MKLKNFIKPAYAHCDVPCGIYETDSLVIAALTCKVMTEKLDATDLKVAEADKTDLANYVREVSQKERQAQIVQDQLLILWSGYFKPEHLEQYPDLLTTLWNAAKAASEVKQHVDPAGADSLLKQCQEIAKIFDKTGGNQKVKDLLA